MFTKYILDWKELFGLNVFFVLLFERKLVYFLFTNFTYKYKYIRKVLFRYIDVLWRETIVCDRKYSNVKGKGSVIILLE